MALVVVASVGACDPGTSEGLDDPGCAGFDEAKCQATAECKTIRAKATPNGARVFVGCEFNAMCGAAVGCGYPINGEGACMYFYDTCVPEGWTFEGADCKGQPDCAQFGPSGTGGASDAGGSGPGGAGGAD